MITKFDPNTLNALFFIMFNSYHSYVTLTFDLENQRVLLPINGDLCVNFNENAPSGLVYHAQIVRCMITRTQRHNHSGITIL